MSLANIALAKALQANSRSTVLEDSTLIRDNTGTLFSSYASITEQGIVSVFKGWKTRFSYSNEEIKAIKASFNIEKSGYNVICTVYDDSSNVIASKSLMANSDGRQQKLFIFDEVLDSSKITTANFYVSLVVDSLSDCKMHPGYIENSARVSGTEGHPNYYIVTGNTEFSASDPTNGFSGGFDFVSESQITTIYPDAMLTQAITDWEKGVTIPSILYAVVGKEFNIYFSNVVSDDVNKYFFDVACDVGTQQNERWTLTASTASTYGWSLTVYDKMMNVVKVVSATLYVVASTANNGVTKECLFIGDSLTADGTYITEINALMTPDVMNVTLLGTQGSSINLHEGYSGWSLTEFMGSGSPFYSGGAFNFPAYMSAHSYADVDWVFIFLGINDIFNDDSDSGVDAQIVINNTYLDAVITSIKAFKSSCKIGICLPCVGSFNQDAFGKNYTSYQTQMRFKRNIHRYALWLKSEYDGRTSENLYVVPTNCNLDTVNNMQTETVAVNARNATTVVRQANGVHPASSGYYQIADTFYSILKNFA